MGVLSITQASEDHPLLGRHSVCRVVVTACTNANLLRYRPWQGASSDGHARRPEKFGAGIRPPPVGEETNPRKDAGMVAAMLAPASPSRLRRDASRP